MPRIGRGIITNRFEEHLDSEMPHQNPQPNQQGMDSAQIATMQALQDLATAMNDLRKNLQTPPPFQSKLHDFFSTRPPILSHFVEPVDADDWLKTIDNKLQISQCVVRERVLYASHQLAEQQPIGGLLTLQPTQILRTSLGKNSRLPSIITMCPLEGLS